MSTPSTCHLPQRQDALFYVLYGSDASFIQRLIEECVINISREYHCAEVHEALVQLRPDETRDTLDRLRAKFFILLHQDMHMRQKLSAPCGKSSIVKEVCVHKAARFYDELGAVLIPEFAQNQKMPLAEFVESLRDAYICS
jgi:hypothetical protein